MALIAAGLREKTKASGRTHTWSEESIIREIQAIYTQPEGHRQVWETHMSMASAARRRFGSWANALQAAGITPVRKVRRRWDRQKVIEAIRQYAGEGLPLQRVYKTDPGLSAAARSFFGSWFNAVVAADLVSATPKPCAGGLGSASSMRSALGPSVACRCRRLKRTTKPSTPPPADTSANGRTP